MNTVFYSIVFNVSSVELVLLQSLMEHTLIFVKFITDFFIFNQINF